MADYNEPKNIAIAAVGIGSMTLVTVMVILLVVFFRQTAQKLIHERVELAPNTALRSLRAEEQLKLNKYVMLDPATRAVRIPIQRAMELEARDPWHRHLPPVAPSAPTPQEAAHAPSSAH
jgi:hypothetical protein